MLVIQSSRTLVISLSAGLFLDAQLIPYIFDALDTSNNLTCPIDLVLSVHEATELDFSIAGNNTDIAALDNRISDQRRLYLGCDNCIIHFLTHRLGGCLHAQLVLYALHAFNTLGNGRPSISLGLSLNKAAQLHYALVGLHFDVRTLYVRSRKQRGFHFCGNGGIVDLGSYGSFGFRFCAFRFWAFLFLSAT